MDAMHLQSLTDNFVQHTTHKIPTTHFHCEWRKDKEYNGVLPTVLSEETRHEGIFGRYSSTHS
jgi:hypothetical protein